MELVLGVSMTPTTVRLVLVEGEKADGATVDHDVFDITGVEGTATSSATDQVIAAILGTRESAVAGGHRLVSAGVAWSDRTEAGMVRAELAARDIDDVMLVSELHAAGALAQAAGRALEHDTTAVFFIERDTATLSVVDTADGSIVKVDSKSLHSTDAMAVLTDMATSLEEDPSRPEGIFLVGSGVEVGSVKDHLENHVTIPISAPEDPEMALARGAALAAATAPAFDALTVGLAYSRDPDGTTAGEAYPAEDLSTEVTLAAEVDSRNGRKPRRPFLLVGSSLTAIFVVGLVALVVSLAVSIRPTVNSGPTPQGSVAGPGNVAAPPSALPNAQPEVAPPNVVPQAAPPPPDAQTIQEPPVPQQQAAAPAVVAQAPAVRPKPVAVEPAEAAAPPAPAPEALPPAPEALPPAPVAAPPAPAPDALPPAPFAPPLAPAPAAPFYPQAPAPASPRMIGLPPFFGFGPGPAARQRDPRWYPPQQQWPQQQWPSGPGSYGPGSYGPGSYGPGSAGPGSYGPGSAGPGSYGPGSYGPGDNAPGSYGPGGSGNPGSGGGSPPWQSPNS